MENNKELIQQYLKEIKDKPFSEGTRAKAYFFDKQVLKVARPENEITRIDEEYSIAAKKNEIIVLEKALKQAKEQGANVYEILGHYFNKDIIWLESKLEGDPIFVANVNNMAKRMGIDISSVAVEEDDGGLLYGLPEEVRYVIARGMIEYYSEMQSKILDLSQDKFEGLLWTISVLNKNNQIYLDLFSENLLVDPKEGFGIIDLEAYDVSSDNLFENLVEAISPFLEASITIHDEMKSDKRLACLGGANSIKQLQINNELLLSKLLAGYGVLHDDRTATAVNIRRLKNRLFALTGTSVVFISSQIVTYKKAI